MVLKAVQRGFLIVSMFRDTDSALTGRPVTLLGEDTLTINVNRCRFEAISICENFVKLCSINPFS